MSWLFDFAAIRETMDGERQCTSSERKARAGAYLGRTSCRLRDERGEGGISSRKRRGRRAGQGRTLVVGCDLKHVGKEDSGRVLCGGHRVEFRVEEGRK